MNPPVWIPALIGKHDIEARAICESEGYSVRHTIRNGIPYAVTRDYKAHRVNFHVDDDIVVEAHIG